METNHLTIEPQLLEEAKKKIGLKKINRLLEGTLIRSMSHLSSKEKKELKQLENKALRLWKEAVKRRAKNQCEQCGKKKHLQAHHIESYTTNKFLRYDLANGVCLCPTCHKWGFLAFHRSFCSVYSFLISKRPSDLEYLLRNYKQRQVTLTLEWLRGKVQELEWRIKNEIFED